MASDLPLSTLEEVGKGSLTVVLTKRGDPAYMPIGIAIAVIMIPMIMDFLPLITNLHSFILFRASACGLFDFIDAPQLGNIKRLSPNLFQIGQVPPLGTDLD